MGNLRTIEKRAFEDLFGMASGYVLDFSNNTFAEFFRETANINIYDEKYSFNGDSKAKRLRAFWEIEADHLVGKVLAALLEIWEYENADNAQEHLKYEKCYKIVTRLNGLKNPTTDTRESFLNRTIILPDLNKLGLDASVTHILAQRLSEIENGIKSKSALSVIFLCGSILEGVLLGTALKLPEKFNKSTCSPKGDSGKVKPFQNWSLADFINVACDVGILQLDVKKFGHELRDFRNYIHPYQQMASNFSPDQHTANICFQVLKAALADISGERNS